MGTSNEFTGNCFHSITFASPHNSAPHGVGNEFPMNGNSSTLCLTLERPGYHLLFAGVHALGLSWTENKYLLTKPSRHLSSHTYFVLFQMRDLVQSC